MAKTKTQKVQSDFLIFLTVFWNLSQIVWDVSSGKKFIFAIKLLVISIVTRGASLVTQW